jgi:hypothetical protein
MRVSNEFENSSVFFLESRVGFFTVSFASSAFFDLVLLRDFFAFLYLNNLSFKKIPWFRLDSVATDAVFALLFSELSENTIVHRIIPIKILIDKLTSFIFVIKIKIN